MKTPWSNLLDYGVGFATVVVMCAAGFIVLSVIAIAVLLSKMFDYIT